MQITDQQIYSVRTDKEGSRSARARIHRRVLGVFALIVFLGSAIVYWIDQTEVARHKREAVEVASLHGHLLQQQLLRSLSLTYGLAALVRQGDGEIEDFHKLATELLSVSGRASAIQLAPDGVIRDVVPEKGHVAAIGHNLLADPERNKEAFLALKTRSLTLAGPFELKQGGQAIVGRLPVFLNAEQPNERFWGFVTVVVRVPDLLRGAALADRGEAEHVFSLTRPHPDGGEVQRIWSSGNEAMVDPVYFPVAVPNGEWTLAVTRTGGWHAPWTTLLWLMLAVAVIATLTASFSLHILRQPARLAKEISRHTAALNEANTSLQAEISQHWQTELALRESERRLEQRVVERTAELERLNEALMAEQAQQRQLIAKLAGARSQLLQSETLIAVGQLAAGVAHEINNPMSFVMANFGAVQQHVSVLLEGLRRQSQALAPLVQQHPALREQLVQIEQELDLQFFADELPSLVDDTLAGLARIKQVVQDLREFSAVDQGGWQLVDLNASLRRVARLLANRLEGRIEVHWQLAEIPAVTCQVAQVNQVFCSILLNAAQAIDGNGQIVVTTREDRGWVDIAIADNGPGIAEENLAHLFEPFFTTRQAGQGSGLGLTVAYRIIEQHGGSIAVTSQVGQGACFTISLPIRQEGLASRL
ncbi:MAG: hypothetical protein CVU34_10825 [Betaproteobacteria bacterium HGW-Betaproteobacteria-7]|jgi:signal transduction histidine kinase|nr:MAG: hypothetical protein CVU34_10825 [Betaproteobacteria bacterium HGW-Betaproteobacteria-7]